MPHRGDALADESKQRTQAPPQGRPPRLWYCRTCGVNVHSALLPMGWYVLARQMGELDERYLRPRHTRLGAYCSADCLGEMLPRIRGIEQAFEAGETVDPHAVQKFLRGHS